MRESLRASSARIYLRALNRMNEVPGHGITLNRRTRVATRHIQKLQLVYDDMRDGNRLEQAARARWVCLHWREYSATARAQVTEVRRVRSDDRIRRRMRVDPSHGLLPGPPGAVVIKEAGTHASPFRDKSCAIPARAP